MPPNVGCGFEGEDSEIPLDGEEEDDPVFDLDDYGFGYGWADAGYGGGCSVVLGWVVVGVIVVTAKVHVVAVG